MVGATSLDTFVPQSDGVSHFVISDCTYERFFWWTHHTRLYLQSLWSIAYNDVVVVAGGMQLYHLHMAVTNS